MTVDWEMVGLFSIFPLTALAASLLLVFLTRRDGQPSKSDPEKPR